MGSKKKERKNWTKILQEKTVNGINYGLSKAIKEIQEILGVNVVSHHEKYLALPSMVGKNKRQFFKSIKLRVLNKLKGWKARLFSSGGKEVLLKAVIQATPVYAMGVFKLPKCLCEDLQRCITNCWSANYDDSKCIHWLSWKNLCKPRKDGGHEV